MRNLQLIFKTVNSNNEQTRARLDKEGLSPDPHSLNSRMNRHEFIEALVRIAIMRYVQSKRIPDCSDAVDRCLREAGNNMPREVFQSSDSFRAKYCYLEQVSCHPLPHRYCRAELSLS